MRKSIIASACGLAAIGVVASYFVLHHGALATQAAQQNEQAALAPDSASQLYQRPAPVSTNEAVAITPTHNALLNQPKGHTSDTSLHARAINLTNDAILATQNNVDYVSVDKSGERRSPRLPAMTRVADNLVTRPALTAKTTDTISASDGVPQNRPEGGGAVPQGGAPQALKASVGDVASSRVAVIAIPSRPRT